jgi:hypothetical protein
LIVQNSRPEPWDIRRSFELAAPEEWEINAGSTVEERRFSAASSAQEKTGDSVP